MMELLGRIPRLVPGCSWRAAVTATGPSSLMPGSPHTPSPSDWTQRWRQYSSCRLLLCSVCHLTHSVITKPLNNSFPCHCAGGGQDPGWKEDKEYLHVDSSQHPHRVLHGGGGQLHHRAEVLRAGHRPGHGGRGGDRQVRVQQSPRDGVVCRVANKRTFVKIEVLQSQRRHILGSSPG